MTECVPPHVGFSVLASGFERGAETVPKLGVAAQKVAPRGARGADSAALSFGVSAFEEVFRLEGRSSVCDHLIEGGGTVTCGGIWRTASHSHCDIWRHLEDCKTCSASYSDCDCHSVTYGGIWRTVTHSVSSSL